MKRIRRPASALVRAAGEGADRFTVPVLWQSEGGAQVGQSAEDVEKLYGESFHLRPTPTGGGRLVTTSMNNRGLASSCKLTLYFVPTAPDAVIPVGEGYMSDDPEARAAQRLSEFTVEFKR